MEEILSETVRTPSISSPLKETCVRSQNSLSIRSVKESNINSQIRIISPPNETDIDTSQLIKRIPSPLANTASKSTGPNINTFAEPSIKSDTNANTSLKGARITETSIKGNRSANNSLKSEKSDKASVKSVNAPLKSERIDNRNVIVSPRSSLNEHNTYKHLGNKSNHVKEDALSNLEPRGINISNDVEQLSESIKNLSKNIENPKSPVLDSNLNKIATMSKFLTNEANALRESIKNLSADIVRTKEDLCMVKETNALDFPYHLFLLEIIINKIHMKCECFEMDYNNLVITATFLGKQPIILYDNSYGTIENFRKLNVGKSSLFAMTYDKICDIEEFEIFLQLTKQPPCTHCVTKLGESRLNYTQEFKALREELCKKWFEEQPKDNILCTTSSPLMKNQFYLLCDESDNPEPIGCIEVTVRMSFLGKEITTTFCASPKPQGTSLLMKEDNGITMYSCQKVEMDDQGKIRLDEEVLQNESITRHDSPVSYSSTISKQSTTGRYVKPKRNLPPQATGPKYDEIFTKMNANELKIRVPKSTKLERIGKYDKIQELCTCERNPQNTGEQIQFELPQDVQHTYSSNLKYTYRGCDKSCDMKDRKIINVTPSNCPVPVDMEKMMHPKKDVFILKIGKKLETKDKKTDLEIELVTPKAPEKNVEINNTAQQCNSEEIKVKESNITNKKRVKGKLKKSKTNLKNKSKGKK